MKLDHASAADLLGAYALAWCTWDGDAFTELHAPDARSHHDPFEPPVVGRNAIRANLAEASNVEEQVELVFERHWVVVPTILAAWHASYVDRVSRARVRFAGFASFEMTDGGLIQSARFWYNRQDSSVQ
ncbi:MAG: nuclear transport factor 2 family protein [Chloroflexota bacterium]